MIIVAAAFCLLLGVILLTVGLLKKARALKIAGIVLLCAAPLFLVVLVLGFRNFG